MSAADWTKKKRRGLGSVVAFVGKGRRKQDSPRSTFAKGERECHEKGGRGRGVNFGDEKPPVSQLHEKEPRGGDNIHPMSQGKGENMLLHVNKK